MKLIREEFRNLKYLKEEDSSGKKYYIEGVFAQAEVPNKNNRVYPRETLFREVDRFVRESIKQNRALSELGHPSGPGINLDRVAAKIISLTKSGNDVLGKAEILDTPMGKIVKNLIDANVNLGVSTRGLGSLKELDNDLYEVSDDFFLATIDIVADPSAPDAYVQGIVESRDWIMENGSFKEVKMSKKEAKTIKEIAKLFSKV